MAFLAALPELLGAAGAAEAGAAGAGAAEAGGAEALGSGRFASMLGGTGVGGPGLEMDVARGDGRHPGLEPGTYKQLSGSEAFFGRGETQADLFPYRFGNVAPGGSRPSGSYRGGRGFEPDSGPSTAPPGDSGASVPSQVSPPSMSGSAGAASPIPVAAPQLSQPVSATVTPSSPSSPSITPEPAASPILPPASRGAYRPMNGFSPSRSASFLSGSGRSLVGS